VLGLIKFTMTVPDTSSFNRIMSSIKSHYFSFGQQQIDKKSDGNQLMVSDPDGIQIVIRSA
jgi:hypothetical protein